jgi:hypothetical protein
MKANEAPVWLPGMEPVLFGWDGIKRVVAVSLFGTGVLMAVEAVRGQAPVAVGFVGAAMIACSAAAIVVMMRRWTHRLSVVQLMQHLQNERSVIWFRMGFVPSLLMFVAGICLECTVGWGTGGIQVGATFALAVTGLEFARRHARRRARTMFALYADGLLAPEIAATIDAARGENPAFDAAMDAFHRWNTAVAKLSDGEPEGHG